jgi:hypothetical protein
MEMFRAREFRAVCCYMELPAAIAQQTLGDNFLLLPICYSEQCGIGRNWVHQLQRIDDQIGFAALPMRTASVGPNFQHRLIVPSEITHAPNAMKTFLAGRADPRRACMRLCMRVVACTSIGQTLPTLLGKLLESRAHNLRQTIA